MSHPTAGVAAGELAPGANARGTPPASPAGGLPLAVVAAAQQPAQRLNPTGRDIPMGGPLMDNGFVLGDISYTLTTDDRILVDTKMLLPMLQRVLTADTLQKLAAAIGDRHSISTVELADLGLRLTYDPSNFGLRLDVEPDMRPRQMISVSGGIDPLSGPIVPAANFSAYVTAAINSDYVHKGSDTGFSTPNIILDSAARLGGFVLENEANIQRRFRREGTRLVYDDLRRTARYTAGDLQPISRGFSGASPMAGASIVRVYADLEPQRNIQPRGQRSFTLTRPSTIETIVNGQTVQQTRLNPGTYDIGDFPFAQGSNDVRLIIRDDTGREEVVSFSLNFDRTLLASGLTEFGLYAGVEAPFSLNGRRYSDRPVFSGFYRRGLTDELTAGGNFQLTNKGGVAGAEIVWAAPLGTLAFNLAGSKNEATGSGYAFNAGYEFTQLGSNNNARSLTATFQTISKKFATPGAITANNPFAYEFGATFSQSFGPEHYVTADAFYSVGRGNNPNQSSFRATHGWRPNQRLLLTTEASYEDRQQRSGFGVRFSLTYRFDRKSSATADVDTRRERARLSYQRSSGTGVGSYNGSVSIDRVEDSVGANANFSMIANRAEFGAAHLTSFSNSGRIIDQRTSLRSAFSLAYADGTVALSRPIYDSFAILKTHDTLGKTPVYIDRRKDEYVARSGAFGGAVMPELSAHTPRLLSYDVPEAPAGYDVGSGVLQFQPPYRSGHVIEVGSDYFISYMGQLLDGRGEPVSLVAGYAYEDALPDRAPIRMFTNRSGRFAIQGLRPGRWRIEMPTANGTAIYRIEIPAASTGMERGGVLEPEEPK